MTLEVAQRRYIFAFGGMRKISNKILKAMDKKEKIFRLDTMNVKKGWLEVNVRRAETGAFYNVIPLGSDKEVANFLVFGGFNGQHRMDATYMFSTVLLDFKKGSYYSSLPGES